MSANYADVISALRAELAACQASRRDEEAWWKERHDYKDRAEKAEADLAAARADAERLRALMGLVSVEHLCDVVHHAKSDRHVALMPCPITARWSAAFTAHGEAQP